MIRTKLACFVFLGVLVASLEAPAWGDANYIVLRVNDQIATLHDFHLRHAEQLRALRAAEMDPQRKARLLAQSGQQTMRQLYEELLLLSRAQQLNIDVTDEMVEEQIAATRQNFGLDDEADFERALAESGTTPEGLREQLRKNLLVQRVMGREIQSRVTLEEEDLRRYYQNHLEEFQVPRRLSLREVIVLDDSPANPAEREAATQDIQERFAKGEPLEEIAAEYAEKTWTTKVVDLGWVESGDLAADLESAAWELPVGALSGPVSARGGLHLIELVEVQEAMLRPFAEVRNQIQAREHERLLDEEFQNILAELEANSYIVANPPPEAAGFRSTRLEDEPESALASPADR